MTNEIKEALLKFFSPKEEVHSHSYAIVNNFQFITEEFYQTIEKELTVRKIPDLEISRIEFAEGGLLSDKRVYLRLRRERFLFDICAAPFGTSYFFSIRFVELPLGIKISDLIFFVVGIVMAFGLLSKLLGTIWGLIVFFSILGGCIYYMRNSIALGLNDFDTDLLKMPVIGPLYEVFLRKETYYREDTRLMFLTTVNEITESIVNDLTASKGVKLLKQFRKVPPLGELYQELPVRQSEQPPKPG